MVETKEISELTRSNRIAMLSHISTVTVMVFFMIWESVRGQLSPVYMTIATVVGVIPLIGEVICWKSNTEHAMIKHLVSYGFSLFYTICLFTSPTNLIYVFVIPMIFVVGWRGEPGVHDEPQHIYQGEVTIKLLEDMDIKTFIVGKETTEEELKAAMDDFKTVLAQGKDAAFVIRKGALSYDEKVVYKNDNTMMREDIIRHITDVSGEDPVISTTGKASRELFEIREAKKMSHKYDFLTVGSMGHSSSIALGVAESMPDTKIWCIDGDGAVLMHMGAMALLGANAPKNMVHVLINNGAHETVGGMPTVGGNIDWIGVAKSCGYPNAVSVDTFEALDEALKAAKNRSELSLIEVKCSIGAREDLGRPTTTALENKENFMAYLKELKG